MSNPTMLQCVTGTENQADGSCSLTMFVTLESGKEDFLARAIGQHGIEKVRTNLEPAVAGKRVEIGGGWTTSVLTIPEGTILKVFAKRRRGWNKINKMAGVYILIRNEAPYHKIAMDTLTIPGMSRRATVEVSGRFDVIPVKDILQFRPKLVIPHNYMAFYGKAMVDGLFKITELEPALTKRPVVAVKATTNKDGEKVVYRVRKRVRNLEIS